VTIKEDPKISVGNSGKNEKYLIAKSIEKNIFIIRKQPKTERLLPRAMIKT
tara:strand:- start:43976 stop:44128 length:153 start_codon:yes stop_codon:yes gene_type:complete